MRGRGDLWTHERIALLRMLWKQGETADAIGARFGLTRSAVLGKIHRLRLHADQPAPNAAAAKAPALNKKSTAEAPARRRRQTKYKSRAPVGPTPAPSRQYKTLLELTNVTCRWPHGRPGTDRFFFCGAAEADLERGIPYCARHMQRAYPNGLALPSPAGAPSGRALHPWR
jgi:GcrA cell cycle regulator